MADDSFGKEAAPRRAHLFDRVQAWMAVALVMLLGSGAAASAVLGSGPAAAVACIGLAAVISARPARRAWALGRGEGRFVMVAERVAVIGTTGRWFGRPWRPRRTGVWLHIVDATDDRFLGWVEVGSREATRIEAIGVAAMFGDPTRRGGAVLVGPFRPAQIVGRSRPDPPTAFFRVAGRLRPSRLRADGWRLPRSIPLERAEAELPGRRR